MTIIWTFLIVTVSVASSPHPSPPRGRVFLKYTYKTLEIVCPDEVCRWSIPLPQGVFDDLAEKPIAELEKSVLEGLKEAMTASADKSSPIDHLKLMRVNLNDPHQEEMIKTSPFEELARKSGVHNPYYGPALTKRFADYEVITCQVRRPPKEKGVSSVQPSGDDRVLLTYAVSMESGAANSGTSLKSGFDVIDFEEFSLETYSAKFANLGRLPVRASAKFCYILTNGVYAVFEKLQFVRNIDQLLDETTFAALQRHVEGGGESLDDSDSASTASD